MDSQQAGCGPHCKMPRKLIVVTVIQWNLSILDTLERDTSFLAINVDAQAVIGTYPSVLNIGESSFQGIGIKWFL